MKLSLKFKMKIEMDICQQNLNPRWTSDNKQIRLESKIELL